MQAVSDRVVEGEEGGAYHENGTWQIEVQGARAQLVLTKSAGGVDQHDALHQGDQFLLDGQVASVSVSNSCL